MTIAVHSGVSACLRWPYQSNVMNTLEANGSKMVRMIDVYNWPAK